MGENGNHKCLVLLYLACYSTRCILGLCEGLCSSIALIASLSYLLKLLLPIMLNFSTVCTNDTPLTYRVIVYSSTIPMLYTADDSMAAGSVEGFKLYLIIEL